MAGQMSNRNTNNLDTRVASLETDMANLVRSVDRLGESFERLASKVGAGTNWGVLGTWSAVLLTIFGGIGWLTITPITKIIETQQVAFQEHVKLEGHPATMAELLHLRELNQRLVKDLDDASTAWQREVLMVEELSTAKRSALEEQIKSFDKRLLSQEALIQSLVLKHGYCPLPDQGRKDLPDAYSSD